MMYELVYSGTTWHCQITSWRFFVLQAQLDAAVAGDLSSFQRAPPRQPEAGAARVVERELPRPRQHQPQPKSLPHSSSRNTATGQHAGIAAPEGDAAPTAIMRGGAMYVGEGTGTTTAVEMPAVAESTAVASHRPAAGSGGGDEARPDAAAAALRQQLTATQLQLSEANNKLRTAQQVTTLPSSCPASLHPPSCPASPVGAISCSLSRLILPPHNHLLSPAGPPRRGFPAARRPPEPPDAATVGRPQGAHDGGAPRLSL